MELFSNAGIDLPATAGRQARRAGAFARALQAPLLANKVVQDALAGHRGARVFEMSDADIQLAADYARKVRDPKFLKQKEMTVREMFAQEVVQTLLRYQPFDPTRPYSLAREHSIASGAVDLAIGSFNAPGAADEVIAPFELKGPDTLDLDKVMPGRGRSPVQQAWDYAIDSPGSRWVLVSNCLEIRLYKFGRGRSAFERFDLTKLDEPDQLRRLWLILGSRNLLEGVTDRLLADTDAAYRDITNVLYSEYKSLRQRLVDFLTNHALGAPGLADLQAIEIAQKLLDRILFIAFAQRTNLMGDKLLERAATEQTSFAPQPLWRNFLGLFRSVDLGSPPHDIPPYNGGLFREDPVADQIIIPDNLAREIAQLGRWDYGREVPVTVLGHLFEQSITDIEELKAGAPLKVSKKKREGVVYTPDMVTRFLIERTVARSLEEKREALWMQHGMAGGPEPQHQIAFWTDYLGLLRDFTIVDPACGSGAFLVAAFDEMARRYRDAASALEALDIEIEFDVFDAILTRNLFGVDLNKESVEISRLSLWLKTARRDHKLQNLEATIKDGNSLIADPDFTPTPFDWKSGFPEVFERGGFDVVIGNPPYVRMEHLKAVKPYFKEHYVVADDRTDLYAYFFEKGVGLLKPGGRLGFISSSTFFKTGSGANLRNFLTDGLTLESIIDFNDIQIFGGVTTYPAILTMKNEPATVASAVGFFQSRRRSLTTSKLPSLGGAL